MPEQLSAQDYIDYARQRLVWFEDFKLAGNYLSSALAEYCDQLLIRTDSSHDTFVAFIPGNDLTTDDLQHVRTAFRRFGATYHNTPNRTHFVVAVFVYSAPDSHTIRATEQLMQGPDSETRQTFLPWTVSLRERALVTHRGSPTRKRLEKHLRSFDEPDTSTTESDPGRVSVGSTNVGRPSPPRRSLRSRTNPWVTHLLLAIIAGMFVLESLQGGSTNINVLVKLGARSNILVSHGEWWRLFTYQFLHIGLLHIGLNGLGLYWLGPGAEHAFGHLSFLLIYLGSGTIGGVAGYLFGGPFSRTVAAGASGAVFGLFGAYAYFALTQPRWARQVALRQIGFIIILNVVFGLSQPGIDNLAHLGGLAGGFLLAVIFGPADRTPLQHRLLALVTLVVAFYLAGGMQLIQIVTGG